MVVAVVAVQVLQDNRVLVEDRIILLTFIVVPVV